MPVPPADVLDPGQTAAPLTHNALNAATGGIWRVTTGGGTAILKIATPGDPDQAGRWATSSDPAHWNYWRRETEAYRGGLAAGAYGAGGIRAPRLLDSVDRADGSVALWLEDIDGIPGMSCSPTQLADFAGRLGAGHARWLGRPPERDWLSRDWLRRYGLSKPVPEFLDWDHPAVAAAWPASLREDLRTLWERRHAVLEACDRLPTTLCHHDVWPMNLIVEEAGPVLVDWAFVGPGAVGEDAANLILDTFFDGIVDVGLLGEVTERVTEAYAAGLAGAVDSGTVRRAIALTGAAKYFWLAPGMVASAARGGPAGHANYDSRSELSAVFEGRRDLFTQLTGWARSAWD